MNPFEGCRQRIERAQLHSNTAADIWNNSLPYSGYRPLVYMHDDGTGSIYVEAIDPALMISISLEFGELFYQLRAALDGAVYESAILESGNAVPPQ